MGLVMLRAVRQYRKFTVLILVASALLADAFSLDFGFYGIVVVFLISRYSQSVAWWGYWIGFHLSIFIVSSEMALFQLPAVVAPLILTATTGQKGGGSR
jgi:hypothetical protein